MSQGEESKKSPFKGTLGFARKLSGKTQNVSQENTNSGFGLEVVVIKDGGAKRHQPIKSQVPTFRKRRTISPTKNKHEERIKEALERSKRANDIDIPSRESTVFAESKEQETDAPSSPVREHEVNSPTMPRVLPPLSTDKRKGGAGQQHEERRRNSGKSQKDHEGEKGRSRLAPAPEKNLKERQYSLASFRRMQEKQKRQSQEEPNASNRHVQRDVVVGEGITVKDLAARMAVSLRDVLEMLKKQGFEMTSESILDADVSHLLVEEFGHRVRREHEDAVMKEVSNFEDPEGSLVPRPPVVVFVGHVDHGKTTLLDTIRSQSLASKEKGGITQTIGAYLYKGKKDRNITFIDTPGHENFSSMRARGAHVTDIAVLVVAANDGVKKQTIEAISHVKASKVPMILAITKCDLAENVRKIHEDLMRYEVHTDALGGDVLSLECSAKTKIGLDTLEEAILLQADELNLRANPNRPCQGRILEVSTEHGRGTVMTLLPALGTLKQGDDFVVDMSIGRVRALYDDGGHVIKEAPPGVPISILGVHGIPSPGDAFFVVKDEATGRRLVEEREKVLQRKKRIEEITEKSSKEFHLYTKEKREIGIVLRAESQGALEVLEQGVMALSYEDDTKKRSSAQDAFSGDGSASFCVLHKGIGAISLADIHLAISCSGVVVSFGTLTGASLVKMANENDIALVSGYILYEVLEKARDLLRDEVSKTSGETVIGRAKVLKIFGSSSSGRVVGCVVEYGLLEKQSPCSLLRDDVVIYKSQILGLRRIKEEVKQVKESLECGLFLNKIRDIQEGDIIECYGESS